MSYKPCQLTELKGKFVIYVCIIFNSLSNEKKGKFSSFPSQHFYTPQLAVYQCETFCQVQIN